MHAHFDLSPSIVFVMADDYELFRAIGEPESPNRRARTALLIKARWMSPGFGLAHRSSSSPQARRTWSGRRGSNPRHSAWEADVLPLNYSRSTI